MTDYELITAAYVVLPEGDTIHSELATKIELDDEAAGLFVKVSQSSAETAYQQAISIAPEEWEQIRSAIDTLIEICRARNAEDEKGAS